MLSRRLLLLISCSISLLACEDKAPIDYVFDPADDVALGSQLHAEISANPAEYPLLSETEYADAYAYLQGMCDELVASGKLDYADVFTYKIHIIDADVLNAFATPGGNLYFYTGLIHFLNEEDDLAGVLGHEIAHADRRHSVKQMMKNYGVATLISAALGDSPSTLETILAQVAGTGAQLAFSRSDESEADEFSVEYLSTTGYRCDGASVFFQQLDSAGLTSGTPAFLSTHPNPDTRIEDIKAKAAEIGCDTTYLAPDGYDAFRAMLP